MGLRPQRRSSLAAGARLRQGWAWLTGRWHRLLESGQVRRARRSGVKVRRWYVRWRQRLWLFPLALLSVGWVLFSLVALATRREAPPRGQPGGWLEQATRYPIDRCDDGYGIYCGAITGFVLPLLGVALGYAVFLLRRFARVRRWYQRTARTRPQDLVPTAGSIIDDVVGRDQLCDVLIGELRDPATRRPQVLVGGVGTGKTAVLVKLVAKLAARNVVPVTIRLRDARPDGFDFQAMAKDRLAGLLDRRLRSGAEADRIWRQLRLDNRVVVLADGLEEALADSEDRDTLVRLAIHQAAVDRLPLVIASRPHDPLRHMEALLIELEPLGEGPALEYATHPDGPLAGDPNLNRQRMSWLIQSAQVIHSPLYLQVIRELARVGRLWSTFPTGVVPTGVDGARPIPALLDRVGLRWLLLEGWKEALVDGYLYEDHVLDRQCRQGVVEVLSALACIGVKQDRLEVRFADLSGEAVAPRDHRPPHPEIWAELTRRLSEVSHPEFATPLKGLPLAATMGAELGIVVAHKEGVRFRHSVIEAYLASRYLPTALRDQRYAGEAFGNAGREFLTTVEFGFHAAPDAMAERLAAHARPVDRGWRGARRYLTDRADDHYEHDRSKYLEINAVTLGVDSAMPDSDPALLLRQVATRWATLSTGTVTLDRAMEEAKLQLVHRFGEAARRVAASRRPVPDGRPAVAGGVAKSGSGQPKAGSRVTSGNPHPSPTPTPTAAVRHPYREFYDLLCAEQVYPVRLAGTQEIGAGGAEAVAALRETLDQPDREPHLWPGVMPVREKERREDILRAWLAPMLYRSCHAETAHPLDGRRDPRRDATAFLDRWLDRLAAIDPTRRDTNPSISLELALAQGFRLAANPREPHPAGLSSSQALLIEKAERALMHSRFWYSQLVLIQALTLLSLPSDPDLGLPDRGHGSDPRRQVDYWLGIAGTRCAGVRRSRAQPPHPFVKAAGELCVVALMTRRPAEYCWIDESGVASRVGSYSRERSSQYSQQSWIVESAGWSSLHPLAQRLLGDVLLMLNLTERGGRLVDMDDRLARADRWDLPPCIANDRSPLEPERTVGSARTSEPGTNCLDDCEFRLCPYPPKGQPFYRSELGEGFCARQISLLGKWYRPWVGANWQKATRPNLKRFWRTMSERVRPEAPDLPMPTTRKPS